MTRATVEHDLDVGVVDMAMLQGATEQHAEVRAALVLGRTVWYCVVLCGTVWYCVVLCGTVWYCGIAVIK